MILLQNNANLAPHIAVIQRLKVEVIKIDRAFGRLEQTGNQLYQRRFSTTTAPNNCDVLAGADIESDPLQDGRRFRPAVAKSKVAQFDMTFKRGDRPQL